MFIETPVFLDAMTKLQALYDGYGSLKEFEGGMLIFGKTGTGKSYIGERLEAMYPPIITNERTIRPVVRVVIDDPSIEAVLITLIDAYGLPVTYRGKRKQLEETLFRAIKNALTRILFIDEASMIAEYRADKTVRFSADLLKTFINKTPAGVVCSGVDTLLGLARANEQFKSRYRIKVATHVWGISMPDTVQDFTAYVCECAKINQIQIPTDGTGVPLITGMLYATDGQIREIHRFLDTVAKCSPQSRGEDLQKIFLAAFEEFSGSKNNIRNPFHPKFNNLELKGRGELYEPESSKR